ncbi:hypothetical protein FRC03_012703 [Tulasnella sp. 419]|nr:hypothetical protein FRC03_012703 [Tulasnella sp. 419]
MLPHFRPKSFTGNHILVPDDENSSSRFIHPTSLTDVSPWKVGSGTVIWRIWPAVLLHTCFAAAVVSVSHESGHNLAISSVMITVVGVVLGFVISYRASSGYDRYWQGRCLWSDVIKTCRTFSRLVWIHVPSRLQAGRDHKPEESESKRAIAEKKAALKLIEGFTVALKHHLRGENGVYYADLYPLLRPLHIRRSASKSSLTVVQSPSSTEFHIPSGTSTAASSNWLGVHRRSHIHFDNGETTPLLQPSTNPPPETTSEAISVSLIPFNSFFIWIWETISLKRFRTMSEHPRDLQQQSTPYSHKRHRPVIAGGGENIPLEIVRYLSEWVATLEERETASGSTLSGMMACLVGMEDSLTALERILTTPLPLVYSAHLSTVWLYLFFLPFQLSEPLGYLAIFAVAVAAFLFLGFLAAGEEIEQPFGEEAMIIVQPRFANSTCAGYDENDLDLDVFIREIIHADVLSLMRITAPNSSIPTGKEDNLGHGLIADASLMDVSGSNQTDLLGSTE